MVMTDMVAKKYLKMLGLRQEYNCLKGLSIMPDIGEKDLQGIMYNAIDGLVRECGPESRVTAYAVRKNGICNLAYNDYEGVNISNPIPLDKIKMFIGCCGKHENYILLVETDSGKFEFVTKM